MTIGRYRGSNRPMPIIGKLADNQLIPIIGRLSVHPHRRWTPSSLSAFVIRPCRL